MSTKSEAKTSKNTNEKTNEENKDKASLKAQRKAQFELQNKDKLKTCTKQAENKSKAELKAERRLKQEMQRMAKNTIKPTNETAIKPKTEPKPIDNSQKINEVIETKLEIQNENKVIKNLSNDIKRLDLKPKTTTTPSVPLKSNQIFAHIPKRIKDLNQLNEELKAQNSLIHPTVIDIGLQINRNQIRGSNSRCVAMLLAFKKVIEDYTTPPSKELTRDLESLIDSYVKFLAKCRPLSISMTNAVKLLKLKFSRIPAQTNDTEAKSHLSEFIDKFIYDEILCAQRGIAELATTKIQDSDVILTFGCSLIIKHVIQSAAQKGKKFRVVIVDCRPRFDGKEMFKFLIKLNIPVVYVYINAISYVMKEVTKVLLGAHSLLANGYVMSHIGSSQIALVAQAYNVPVIVCCETFKFSERVLTDSFVYNEIGDSAELLSSLSTSGKSQIDVNNKDLNFLDLLYDVIPHEFVSVVITEKGILPCTSAPAVLRVREIFN